MHDKVEATPEPIPVTIKEINRLRKAILAEIRRLQSEPGR